ncbi:MAG: RagB/SusD family nutrient uptake outer membrane protein [Alistipes sp.]
MKRLLILGIIAFGTLSCSKDALETFPGNKVPSDIVYGTVENASSALTGTLSGLGTAGWGGTGPLGFGLTEAYLTADALAEDYVLAESGNGWMWQAYSYNVKDWFDDSRLQCNTEWNCFYTTINNCNNLIAAGELLKSSAAGKSLLGQAYVLRAMCYHYLAQFYARAYFYHKDDMCVPVYLEPTTSATKGQPRSTNKHVYEEVIVPDLTAGVALLKESLDAKISRKSKTEIDYYVANGIKARVALTMHEWATASAAAEEALKGYDGKMLTPAQVLSGMNDITALQSVMWGEVKTTDNYGMYGSFFSQMDADHDGYAQSARRCITSWLYNKMNPTDVRRGWWLGNFDNANYAASGQAIKYCQVKFKFIGTSWLGDYTYMRAEEMLLIAAEAYCQAGNDAQARSFLSKLMSQRDPSYKGASKSGKALSTLTTDDNGSLLTEILIQRRIELWGESGRIFDIKRLGQGFKRAIPEKADNPNYIPAAALEKHNTDVPDSFAWVLLLPQVELDGNQAIPDTDQNPSGDTK